MAPLTLTPPPAKEAALLTLATPVLSTTVDAKPAWGALVKVTVPEVEKLAMAFPPSGPMVVLPVPVRVNGLLIARLARVSWVARLSMVPPLAPLIVVGPETARP